MSNRPYTMVKRAAKELGVGPELIQGLIEAKKVDGFRDTGNTGAPVWMIYKDEVARLRESMTSR